MELFLTFTGISLLASILGLFAIRPNKRTNEDDREETVKRIIRDLFREKNLERMK